MAKVLTSKFVETAKAGEYWDAAVPGFSLRVMASGYRSFSFRYRSGGYKRLSWKFPAYSLAEAREEALKAIRAAERGEVPATRQISPSRPLPTVYLEHLKKTVRRWKTAETELSYVLPWKERSKAEIKELVAGIAKKHPVQANRVLSRLRAMYNWAVSEDLRTDNPTLGIKKSPEKPRARVLSDDELKAIWLASDKLSYPAQEIIRLLILTGQRRDEVRELHSREIDRRMKNWVIPAERYKTRRSHLVPLSPAALALCGDRKGFAFSLGGERAFGNLQKPKRTLDKVSGVSGWTLHDIRRTVRTGLSRLGIRPDIAERVIGHSVGGRLGETYDLYSYRDEKLKALETWESFVMGLLEEKIVALRTQKSSA